MPSTAPGALGPGRPGAASAGASNTPLSAGSRARRPPECVPPTPEAGAMPSPSLGTRCPRREGQTVLLTGDKLKTKATNNQVSASLFLARAHQEARRRNSRGDSAACESPGLFPPHPWAPRRPQSLPPKPSHLRPEPPKEGKVAFRSPPSPASSPTHSASSLCEEHFHFLLLQASPRRTGRGPQGPHVTPPHCRPLVSGCRPHPALPSTTGLLFLLSVLLSCDPGEHLPPGPHPCCRLSPGRGAPSLSPPFPKAWFLVSKPSDSLSYSLPVSYATPSKNGGP